jgi:stress response protein YsnF
MALYGGTNMFEPSRREPATAAARTTPSLETGPRSGQRLPLQALVDRTERGVRIRLTVRAEHVWVEKEAFVYEDVVVQQRPVEETVHAVGRVRNEELRTDERGDLP